ncbi:PREDICTED: phosphatidylinositol 4-phosphate 5-kinase 6-like [Eufriesea mexicana]|uniref:phosphatidylinositol 4-phosphate 5-kinase 6-like n=1 Tax=Eufriesea mexicana TaxID=516756 RepID=UPI00083C42E3|nr:PREDICTED: phosphatidylinositol 4-phosphate 5-kinase 6-like [Eufriesea mexicana]
MKKQSASKTGEINNSEIINQNIQPKVGKFMFCNGDVYDGEYKINRDRFFLVKQGKGTYITDNFDVYHGEWDEDTFANTDIHIKYNNDAQYRGRIDSNGMMNGLGTYIFPDGSSIEAIWFNNMPSINIIYKEPLGFAWIVDDVSANSISFSAGNHFWTDMTMSDRSTTHSTKSFNQSELN